MNNLIDEINSNIEEFLSLSPTDVKEADKLGKKISILANEIGDLVLKKDIKEKYDKISARLKKYSIKLSNDLLSSKNRHLTADWERFAQQDKRRLKDEILSLREFLHTWERVLRKRLNEEIYGIDLQDLASILKTKDFLDNLVCTRFSELVREMGKDEIQDEAEKHEERLKRISNWLLLLKEVEDAER